VSLSALTVHVTHAAPLTTRLPVARPSKPCYCYYMHPQGWQHCEAVACLLCSATIHVPQASKLLAAQI
jgi:hypothetical protein